LSRRRDTKIRAPRPARYHVAPNQTVEVTPPAGTVRLRNDQAEQIGGVYDMANGWSVLVRAAARYVDVTIDGNRPMRLRAV